jgi:hypothetical protein
MNLSLSVIAGANDMPTIVLFNPISERGHLNSWIELYIRALLSKGWSILLISKHGATLKDKLSEIQRNNSQLKVRWIDPPSIRISRQIQSFVNYWLKLFFGAPKIKIKLIEDYYYLPEYFALHVNTKIRELGVKPDFVLNTYLDTYSQDQDSWDIFFKNSNWPWAGVVFDPNSINGACYINSISFRGGFVLSEEFAKQFKESAPEKYLQYLPDIANTFATNPESPLVKIIQKLSNGRKIIFMGGAIGRTKNLLNWIRLCHIADSTKWFFVQIGRIDFETLTSEELEMYQELKSNCPENIYIRDEYVKDESEFNGIISISSLIFAAYTNFNRTSNMLSKASFYEIPIVVSKKSLMGRLVEEYRIGYVVNELDHYELCKVLESVLITPVSSYGFSKFNHVYSFKNFTENLNSGLMQMIK